MVTAETMPYKPFNEDLLQPLTPGCQIITSCWAGYNEYDVDWMTSQGMWFCNTVDAVAESTADMAMFLTIAVVRNTYVAERNVRRGLWSYGIAPTQDPAGMTLGIVGMGNIGRYLARKAAVFNMRVLYHNRRRLSPEMEDNNNNITYCATLHELLAQSDVVSINCPLTPQTTNLISTAEFAAMKRGSFLVNTARGPVVDEDALIAALESGQVARAGLDVFRDEPRVNEYFRNSDRVVLQPHVAGDTEVSYTKAQREGFENVKALFGKGRPVAPVNEVV